MQQRGQVIGAGAKRFGCVFVCLFVWFVSVRRPSADAPPGFPLRRAAEPARLEPAAAHKYSAHAALPLPRRPQRRVPHAIDFSARAAERLG